MSYPIGDESIFDAVTNSLETISHCISKELRSLHTLLSNSNNNNMSFPFQKEETLSDKITKQFSSFKHFVSEYLSNLGSLERKESGDVICRSCKKFYSVLSDVLVKHGWHIVFAVIVGIVVWTNFKPKFDKWRDGRRHAANQDRDPDSLVDRHEAMEIARKKMQEKHDKEATLFREKLKEKKATKLSEQPKVEKPKTRLRPDVNPLTRDYGGSSYRPCSSNFNSGG